MERCLWGCLTDDSGERLNGIQEVSGSIPLISTIGRTVSIWKRFFAFLNQTASFPFGNEAVVLSVSL